MKDKLRTLRELSLRHAADICTSTAIPRVDLFKVTRPSQLFPEIYQPFVSLILQGEKQLMIGSEVLGYRSGDTFVASVDLPATGEISEASVTSPYLAVRLTLDMPSLAELCCEVVPPPLTEGQRVFGVYAAGDDLLDAWVRMLRLLDNPDEIPIMAPLLEREILFRLLRGSQAAVLFQVTEMEGPVSGVRRALNWIKMNYRRPFRVEDLAADANMSVSAFHRSFKASTGFSPLQYQKRFRLSEARRLLLTRRQNVASVAFEVGYESLSQFTREYARMFGSPPARDAKAVTRAERGEMTPA